MVNDAVLVLRASGHDPARYRVELREEDRFSRADGALEPRRTVVFLPLAGGTDYALGVSSADPCVVAWVWQPEDFTPWQREVLGRAREAAGAAAAGWGPVELLEVRVTETLEHVGIAFRADLGPEQRELRIVLTKADLTMVVRRL